MNKRFNHVSNSPYSDVFESTKTGVEYRLLHCISMKKGKMDSNPARLVYIKGRPTCLGKYASEEEALSGIIDYEDQRNLPLWWNRQTHGT